MYFDDSTRRQWEKEEGIEDTHTIPHKPCKKEMTIMTRGQEEDDDNEEKMKWTNH